MSVTLNNIICALNIIISNTLNISKFPAAPAAGGAPGMDQINALMQQNPEMINQIIGQIAQENPAALQVRLSEEYSS